ncbi:MAG: inorganic phosphate transporter [Alphaproteobacteria bacterium]|nr:inorganic phosphate transporter [Alphaproteobacteria bacterium]
MSEQAMMPGAVPPASHADHPLHSHDGGLIQKLGPFVAFAILGIGAAYACFSLVSDLESGPSAATAVYLLLGLALLIALGFEFVNGFHDTANAVATVIYTNSMPPHAAVIWSGCFNFLGVLLSSGAVAFGIISLLPVELILQVGSNAGFAMVFALLIAAILWNLGTWYYGIPNSSSHALIGSIIGVGLMNQLMSSGSGTSGVDWDQAAGVGKSLLFSPLAGFFIAGLMLILAKFLLRIPALYKPPVGKAPPPWWIRALLIFTCTGVSFAHGSNDGQKGMGLIMLILIGTVPTTYALNRAVPESYSATFEKTSVAAAQIVNKKAEGYNMLGNPRPVVTQYVARHEVTEGTFPALSMLVKEIGEHVKTYGTLAKVPPKEVGNERNDMYLASEAIRLLMKDKAAELSKDDVAVLNDYKKSLDTGTKFIPTWVKVAVAIALGLGTMVGWKRIVVTVGEKIGKEHLSYGQGAAAELTAMGLILAADGYGLPASTTHVLSSGVAGTMAANGSGLQMSTLRSMALAWVLTLPAAIVLSGSLFALLRYLFG